MTAVPKPLKYLAPHWEALKKLYAGASAAAAASSSASFASTSSSIPAAAAALGGAGKTAAQQRFEGAQRRRLGERARKEAGKSHREKIEALNTLLETMPEHYDLFRISYGGQG